MGACPLPVKSGGRPTTMPGTGARSLGELVRALSGVREAPAGMEVRVRGVTHDSRTLNRGEIFVAVEGAERDGAEYIREAAERGAAAVVTEKAVPDAGVPVVRVRDTRIAIAELAAEWHDRPAASLSLTAITGSLGKTSVLSMLAAILEAAGIRAGVIGSLGVHCGDLYERTPLTTPEPLALHAALEAFVARGAEIGAMEVTSHALEQRRVHGLCFDLLVFTNLVLLEHLDYHGSFRRYVEAKAKIFEHLAPGAPVVYPAGDRVVRALLRARDVTPIACGTGGCVTARVDRPTVAPWGTRLQLTVRKPIPRRGGGWVDPTVIPIRLRLLGRSNLGNAALAAVAGLALGAGPEAVRSALEALPPPRRRLEIIHRGKFTVLDDTVGHPDSISVLFDVVRRLRYRSLHLVYGVRGRRGPEINRRDAEALAIWTRTVRPESVIVTSSEERVDERNRVRGDEREAVLKTLAHHGVRHEYRPRLADAVEAALARAGRGDMVIFMGAQGMDASREIALEWIHRNRDGSA